MTATDIAQIDWHEFDRRSDERLAELQQTLLPEHADEVLAIEPYTGDYVLAGTRREAFLRFREQFPGKLSFMVRVDGGPILKYHNRLRP